MVTTVNRKDIVEYIVSRVRAGAKVRFKHDFYGSPFAEIPKWYGLKTRIPLSQAQLDQVKGRLRPQ